MTQVDREPRERSRRDPDEERDGRPPSVLRSIFNAGMQGVMQSAGFILVVVSALSFIYAIATIITTKNVVAAAGPNFWQELIATNFQIIAIVSIGIVLAFFGLRLFSKAGSLTSQVIPDKDRALLEPLIQAPNKEAIGEYIRLASLSGFPGTFHKLGFTGLPLATVALTLILLGVAFFVDNEDLRKGVFDMAKLTLGAFLGSFVQRNVEQERLIQGGHIPGAPSPQPQSNRQATPPGGAQEKPAQQKPAEQLAGEQQATQPPPPGKQSEAEKDPEAGQSTAEQSPKQRVAEQQPPDVEKS